MDKTRQSSNLVSENNIFSDITNNRVGIGTTIPQYTLDVLGNINFSGSLNQGGSSFVASRWTAGTGDDIYRLNGDVGIGITNPSTRLHVDGDITASSATFSGNVSIAGTLTYEDVTNVDSIGLVTARSGANVTGGNVLIGTATSTGTASQLLQVTGGGYFSGNVGIGTTNPQGSLQVGTAITMYASTGIVSATSYRGDGSQLSGISLGTDITSCLFT